MKKRRVGIYGGTFNPPHNGHIISAMRFCDQMALDELKIIPAFIPPHKAYDSVVSCDERIEMCKIAFSDIDKATISDIEIKRGGTSYTYLTLQELTNEEDELFFLCGTDMILSMDNWRNPEIIFELANICYFRREDEQLNKEKIEEKVRKYKADYNATIYEIIGEPIDISSSQIRDANVNYADYLPPSIIKYIKEKGLYQ